MKNKIFILWCSGYQAACLFGNLVYLGLGYIPQRTPWTMAIDASFSAAVLCLCVFLLNKD